jgi:DNA mismatch endonuclease, patch repair protein
MASVGGGGTDQTHGKSGRTVSMPTVGWVSTAEGAHLRGRGVRNTAPEMALRRAVHSLGLRFRLQRTLAGRCRPDIVFPGPRVAVFVDGCFWHGCPQHGPSRFKGPNAELWKTKIATNQARDIRTNTALSDAGWQVVRVWECEVRRDVSEAAQRVAAAVRRSVSDNDRAPAD